MRINDNIPSLHAFTSLSVTNRGIEKHMRNIATGYRINSVRDDAAGMAISQKMRTQLRGLEQSSRNSMDGISLVQTAEGALQEISNMLQRIRELAVQGSNDTNTASDRRQIDYEVQQLKDEINAITDRTEFNKIKLLNGSAARLGKIPVDDRTAVQMTYVSDAMFATNLTYTIESFGMPANYTMDLNLSSVDWRSLVGQKMTVNGVDFRVEEGDDTLIMVQKLQEALFAANLNSQVLANATGHFGDWDDVKSGNSRVMIFAPAAGREYNITIGGDVGLLHAFGISAQFETRGTDASIINATIATGEPFAQSPKGNRVELTGNAGRQIVLELRVGGPDPQGRFYVVDDTVTAPFIQNPMAPYDWIANVHVHDPDNPGTYILQPPLFMPNPNYTGPPADTHIPLPIPFLAPSGIMPGLFIQDAANNFVPAQFYEHDGTDWVSVTSAFGQDPTNVIPNPFLGRHILSQTGTISDTARFRNSQIEIMNFGTLKFQIGPNHNMNLDVQIPTISSKGLGIENVNIRSLEWAQRSIRYADEAMSRLNRVRTRLGAYQNRLEHTIASLDVANENTSSSLSRLYDANVAWEMTKLSSLNVISQAGMAIMAQANQRPQQLLQLIR